MKGLHKKKPLLEVHANKIWEYGRLEFLIKLAGRSQESTKERVKNIIKAVVGINTCKYSAFMLTRPC